MTEMIVDFAKSYCSGIVGVLLCVLARFACKFNPSYKMEAKKNPADYTFPQALSTGSYYLAVMLSLGGPLSWASQELLQGIEEIILFGVVSIVLLNLSIFLADRTYLKAFDLNSRLREGSLAAGLLKGAHSLTLGLITLGASWGDTGGVWVMAAFWLLGQLLLAGTFLILSPRKSDDLAVALSVSGKSMAWGMIGWSALSGPFLGWEQSLWEALAYYVVGVGAVMAFRALADLFLFPKTTFSQEIQRLPKGITAIGLLDATLTVGLSLLITWVLL